MWLVLLLVFIGLWLTQIWLTSRQVKHYQKTVEVMSDRASGYLGVGVEKKRFGKGSVLIVVVEDSGTVVDCQLMSGVTVFSEFKKCKRFIGGSLYQDVSDVDEDLRNIYNMAITKVEEQMTKQERVLNLT